MTVIDYTVRNATFTQSAFRHVELEIIEKTRKNSSSEIYYSPSKRTALVKYTVPSGMKGSVNTTWTHSNGSDYEVENYPLGGATLFVLFSFSTRKIFHAHIRVSGSSYIKDDTEIMRRANNLTWKVKPFPMIYDGRYERTTDKPIFPSPQLPKR